MQRASGEVQASGGLRRHAPPSTIPRMEHTKVGSVELCYELLGEPGDPCLLLVNGLGGQLIAWDDGFLEHLQEQGFRVLRFDNRDAGLSTEFSDGPAFDLKAGMAGDKSAAAYTLDEMADDAAGLLDVLGIPGVHVVGVSMGGMIAQTMAIRHPSKVLTLCSIMSTTGSRNLAPSTPEAQRVLMTRPPEDRSSFIEKELETYKVIGSPDFGLPDDRVREGAAAAFDRSFRPDGVARQLMAVMVSGDRTLALNDLDVPTLVIHGEDDPLIRASGGKATAEAIPGSRLLIIPGMGHDLPPATWSQIVAAIVDNARRAGERVR